MTSMTCITRSTLALVSFITMLALPGAARADLSLQLGEAYGPNAIDPIRVSPEGPYYFDIRFNETGAVQREGLFTYDVGLRVQRPAGVTRGLRLLTGDAAVAVPPEIPGGDFVLPATPPPLLTVIESDADHVIFNVTMAVPDAPLPDIDQGERAARVYWTWEPFAPEGVYRVLADPDITAFGSGDPNLPLAIEVEMTDAFVVFLPEPGALSLLAAAAPFALRRWRGKSQSPMNTDSHR
jgi:hypothetical protein